MNFLVVMEQLLGAFKLNTQLFFITLLFSLPLGLVISFGSMSKFKPLSWLTQTVVWVVRGTPLMLQLIAIYYGPAILWNWPMMQRLMAASVAFVVNYACYFSEIYRGGIQSIPKGQQEAGQVLGMTKSQIFFKVTLLQVVKRILPPMGNEFLTLIKDTSLANIIVVQEIIHRAKEYSAHGQIMPLFYTAFFFLFGCGILTLLFKWLEKKMNYFR